MVAESLTTVMSGGLRAGGKCIHFGMIPFDSNTNDPLQAFKVWLAEAGESEQNDPSAAALATATPTGLPSVRMVLTKGVDDRGVRFFSNGESQKGEELQANPNAALCFHWKSLRRQVRFEGRVEELSREETAAYFHSRSRGSQIAAAVSAQSRPLASRQEFDDAVRSLAESTGQAEIPLPDYWLGYLLVARRIEFWIDGEDRRHDRLRFTKDGSGWQAQRLYP